MGAWLRADAPGLSPARFIAELHKSDLCTENISLTCGILLDMRVQPYSVSSVVHVVKRGARGMSITKQTSDRWRFVRILYLLNDTYQNSDWTREKRKRPLFYHPSHWPERDPLVDVVAWTLMPNHFHLLLHERREGGVSKFMQRLSGSMTTHHNEKYNESGSLFQGSYKSRTVDVDEYLRYVFAYITVKNVFELYPGGLAKAVKEFNEAWEWGKTYPFSSFQTTVLNQSSPIVNFDTLRTLALPGTRFKQTAKNMLGGHLDIQSDLSDLFLEKW